MIRIRNVFVLSYISAACIILIETALIQAQTIRWSVNYATARQEATEKGLPLILEFGSDHCIWCQKLDAATMSDPQIAGVIGKHFIALRVNASNEPSLAQALRIRSFPTLVFADSDGKILGTLEGFVDAPTLLHHLQSILNRVENPPWMIRDYEAASRAVALANYPKAISLLKGIAADGRSRKVQKNAKELLLQIEEKATQQLMAVKSKVESADNKQTTRELEKLMNEYAGTQTAVEAEQLLKRLTNVRISSESAQVPLAGELLVQARDAFKKKQYLRCLELCDLLVSQSVDQPEAAEARTIASSIRNDPDRLATTCEQLDEKLAKMYLTLADVFIANGRHQEAVNALRRVRTAFPNSGPAETARTRLENLNSLTNRTER